MQTSRNGIDMEESLITSTFFYIIEIMKRTEYMKEWFFKITIDNVSAFEKRQETLFFKYLSSFPSTK